MSRIVLFWVSGLVVALGAAGVRAAPAVPHSQIRALMADMALAAHAHDTDRFLRPFVHGPSLVFVVNGKIIRGWARLHAAQLTWWRNGKSDVVYTPVGKTRFTDLAPGLVLTTMQLASKRSGPDGKPATGTLAVTDVWKKLPNGWRIVYAHESWARSRTAPTGGRMSEPSVDRRER